MIAIIIIALLAFAGRSTAFWRMECRGVAGYYRVDPLISPGKPSQHLHAIMGSGAMSETATYEDLVSANCTSCLVTQDKSAYWHPALYFEDSTTGEYELVEQVGGTLAYYFLNTGNGNPNITAFPKGFRMIAGDTFRRNYTAGNVSEPDPPQSQWSLIGQDTQEYLRQRALGFNCLHYKVPPNEGSLWRHYMPEKDFLDEYCFDGLRLELMFPSCWNGVDLDSENHKDHVAYSDLVMDGDCPEDFPVRLPGLFYETIWDTYAYVNRSGRFVISNGDTTGFGYHGDFIMGWDPVFLQEAVNTCTNNSGEIGDCPIFNIQNLTDAQACQMAVPEFLASENGTGPGLTALPGNVQIQDGPEPATAGAPGGEASSVPANTAASTTFPPLATAVNTTGLATSNTTASSTCVSTTTTPVVSTSATESQVSATTPITTTAPSESFTDVSTTLVTGANVVSKIILEEAVVVVTTEIDTTSTVTVTAGDTATTTSGPGSAVAKVESRGLRRHIRYHQNGLGQF